MSLRKLKKREYRRLWIARINAGARICGTTYRLINGLKLADVNINRKVLADLAITDMTAFKELVDIAMESRSVRNAKREPPQGGSFYVHSKFNPRIYIYFSFYVTCS